MEVLKDVLIGLFPIAIMLSVGVDLTVSRLVAVFKRPRALIVGLALNHLVLPAAFLGITDLFTLALPVATGVLVCGAAPGGPIGAMFTQRARGDLAFATSLLVVMTLANTVLTPVLLGVLIPVEIASGESHVMPMIQTIVLYLIVPLSVGIGVRHARPKVADRLLPHLKLVTNIIFAVLVVGMGITQWELAFQLGLVPVLAIVLCVLLCVSLGYALGGSRRELRTALALTSGVRNVSLSLLLAAFWFPDPTTLLTVLTYGLMMVIGGAVVTVIMRRPGRSHT